MEELFITSYNFLNHSRSFFGQLNQLLTQRYPVFFLLSYQTGRHKFGSNLPLFQILFHNLPDSILAYVQVLHYHPQGLTAVFRQPFPAFSAFSSVRTIIGRPGLRSSVTAFDPQETVVRLRKSIIVASSLIHVRGLCGYFAKFYAKLHGFSLLHFAIYDEQTKHCSLKSL